MITKTAPKLFASKLHACDNSTDATALLNTAQRNISAFSTGDDAKAQLAAKIEKTSDKLEKMIFSDYLSRLTGSDDAARISTYDAVRIWKNIRKHYDEMFEQENFLDADAAKLNDFAKELTKLYNTFPMLFPVPAGEKRP